MAEGKTRLQFEVPNNVVAEMEALKILSGATTRAEVFRSALKLYAWYLRNRIRGVEIFARETDSNEKTYPPF